MAVRVFTNQHLDCTQTVGTTLLLLFAVETLKSKRKKTPSLACMRAPQDVQSQEVQQPTKKEAVCIHPASSAINPCVCFRPRADLRGGQNYLRGES